MRTSLCAARFLGGNRSLYSHRAGVLFSIASLVALSLTFTGTPTADAGCTDYGSILSSACDGCASNCNSLASAGAGCGCGDSVGGGGSCGAGLSDYVVGSCGCGGSNGGCTGCGGSGLGCNFWNGLGGGGCGGGLGGGLLSCRSGGCGGGLLGGLLGGAACGGGCGGGAADSTPGAGTQADDGSAVFCGMPAPTYPVPYAVPSYVGHTQFAYPPFMPHHSLPHYRKIYSYRHAPGMSRTNVHWRNTTGRDILARLHNMIELPR